MSIRRVLVGSALIVAFATFAPVAAADGLPVLGIDVGSTGVAAPSGHGALRDDRRARRHDGRARPASGRPGPRRPSSSRGTYTIPAVAYDGSASGLSGDRHTLVLIEPRTSFPRATTSLLVLRTPSLAHRALVRLRGDFSFDAVSPDGSRLYLIQYLSPTDPTRYAVRSFVLATMRLAPRPIVDPREPDEKMRGNPLSRAMSADGRFAYTLYDGGGTRPFIHALDTARATARCIDVVGLDPTVLANLSTLRLHMGDGGRVVQIAERLANAPRPRYAHTHRACAGLVAFVAVPDDARGGSRRAPRRAPARSPAPASPGAGSGSGRLA